MSAHSFEAVRRVFARTSLLVIFSVVPARAQTVTGHITGADEAEPIGGAIVTLWSTDGQRVRGVLSQDDGRFFIQAPAPGTYRLRAEMLGRRTGDSELFDIGVGPAVVNVALAAQPIRLEEMLVKASSRCETGPDVGIAAVRVWEEVEKALRAESVARELALYEFDIRRARRTLDPVTRQVVDQDVTEGKAVAQSPFRTLPPTEIAANGYAKVENGQTHIYGPNTDVMLSPEFQDTHCFSLKRKDDRLGLVFKPLSGRRVTDIEGVIWVDAETAELQRLEFKYKRVPYGLVPGMYSGFAEFHRLEGGAWIIARWRLSTPASVTEAEVIALEPVRSVEREPGAESGIVQGSGNANRGHADPVTDRDPAAPARR